LAPHLYKSKSMLPSGEAKEVNPALDLILKAEEEERACGQALAYRLLGLFRHRALPFVLGVPPQGRKLLPERLGTINDAPQGSTLLVDKAYLRFGARESQKLGFPLDKGRLKC